MYYSPGPRLERRILDQVAIFVLKAYKRQNPQEGFEVVMILSLDVAIPILPVEQTQGHDGPNLRARAPVMTRLSEDRRQLPVDQETALVHINHEI